MISFQAMDYAKKELLTIRMTLGPPTTGSVKVFNYLDQEIENVEKVTLVFDERNEAYEAVIVSKGQTRTATIVGIEGDE